MSRATLCFTMASLAGCPIDDISGTDTDSCDAYGVRPLESVSLSPGVAGTWSFVAIAPVTKDSYVDLLARITNHAEEDCPAAIYQSDDAPTLQDIPVLDLSSAPPGTIDGLGQLADDRVVPRSYEEPGVWNVDVPLHLKPDQPKYVTVISGCPLLSEGDLSIVGTCLNEIESALVP